MKKTRKLTIGIIIIGILLLGIGYAAIQNITLYIKGTVTANPSQANFKVRFTEVKEVSDESKVTAEITDELNATVNVEGLTTVDEIVSATYEIKNESENLSSNLTMTTTNDNEEYFEIQSELEKTSIVAGETTTVTITVKLIKEPTESESAAVNVEITAIPVQPGEGGTFGEENTPEDTFAQMVKENPTMYYGKYVDYTIDIDLEENTSDNDWKVFYSDGKNVFLIADDYVPNEKLTKASSMGMIKEGNYGICFRGSGLKDYITNSNYMISKATTFSNSNTSYKIVANLLDTSQLENFVDGTLADSAIVTPTLEMWIASWNNLYEDKLYCNNANEIGYYIGISSNPTTTEINISNYDGVNNKLYFPRPEPIDYVEEQNGIGDSGYCDIGYWLASPTAANEYTVYEVRNSGRIFDSFYGYSKCLRPVVCLNENVTATLNGEVLELSK